MNNKSLAATTANGKFVTIKSIRNHDQINNGNFYMNGYKKLEKTKVFPVSETLKFMTLDCGKFSNNIFEEF